MRTAVARTDPMFPASRICLGRSVTDFRGQQLVDAPAIEIDDLEAPTFYLNVIADILYPAEMAEQAACNRLVVTRRRQLEPVEPSILDCWRPARIGCLAGCRSD